MKSPTFAVSAPGLDVDGRIVFAPLTASNAEGRPAHPAARAKQHSRRSRPAVCPSNPDRQFPTASAPPEVFIKRLRREADLNEAAGAAAGPTIRGR